MDYIILGGRLTIDKHLFVKESLKTGSHLRLILGFNDLNVKKVKDIQYSNDTVNIRYTNSDNIRLPDNFEVIMKDMKTVYTEKIHGHLMVLISADFDCDDYITKIVFP